MRLFLFSPSKLATVILNITCYNCFILAGK